MSTLIETARTFARHVHAGQFRRDGVTPYILHPAAVADRLKGESDETIAVAWLHDVLEDSDTTEADLHAAGISEHVAHAVWLLTKPRRESYETYLQIIKAHPIARKVKIADMLSNLADSPTDKQIVKYARGLLILMEP